MRAAVALLLLFVPLMAADPDYSGIWKLNPKESDLRSTNEPNVTTLRIEQRGNRIHCTAIPEGGGAAVSWDYTLDQKDAKYKIGDTSRNSRLKWEGNALLVNTLVSARNNTYTVMDRWKMSKDGRTLTIHREIESLAGEREELLVYEKQPDENAASPK
ncbi:MAG TPA: hypothetical protein VMJ34_09810 [Bryobacteraceae bacterium]|nr:hypothetical protein [Bryobacteraceae bacterium]